MITGNPKPLRGLGPDHVWSSPKPLSSHRRKVLEFRLSKVGFPIRKSADQSFFAAPHGLSQRSTSFIASQRQGIHRMPLRHLIALIIDTHHRNGCSRFWALNQKDQLASDRSDGVRSSSRQCTWASPCLAGERTLRCIRARRLRIDRDVTSRSILGAILPLHDVRYHACASGFAACRRRKTFSADELKARLVEPDGIEPTTSCLQSRRSPN